MAPFHNNIIFVHHLDVNSRREFFTSLSKHLLAHLGCDNAQSSEDDVLGLSGALLQRERLGSTAIGRGIALPHLVSLRAKTTTCCIATTKRPIHFDASDDRPVDLFGVLLLPESASHSAPTHLEQLRKILTQRGLRSRLRSVGSDTGLKALFSLSADQTAA